MKFRLQKMGLGRFRILNPQGRKLVENYYQEVKGASPQGDGSQPPTAP